MKRQKQEPGNFSEKPGEQGGQEEGSRAPKGGSSEKGPGDGARKKRKNPRLQPVSEVSLRKLKRLHGESQGRNQAVEEELRARGFNAQMLKEAEWQHAQQQWEKNLRQSGHAVAPGAQGKEDELAKWRRLPSGTHSAAEVQTPPRKTKWQRQIERLRQRDQERAAGLRRRKKRR
jgi:hypothetical protein